MQCVKSEARKKLLLIGWDAADWDVMEPLMAAGRMPHLSRLVREGSRGNLASLRPCLTPMLWTTIATGHLADQHGILGFAEVSPEFRVQPSQSSTRKVPALWNMMASSGYRSLVITWPVSDPPEEVPGVYVSAGILNTLAGDPDHKFGSLKQFVFPADRAEKIQDWCFHPCEFAVTDMKPFLPDVLDIDITQDRRPETLARMLARAASTHAIATGLMEQEDWDFCAVYYETIDRVSHEFMSYRPPLMEGVSDAEMHRYGGVVDAMYEFHDALLGRLLELAGPETRVCLLSDHGFHSGAERPPFHNYEDGVIGEDGADHHRMMGVIVMHGPNILPSNKLHGMSLLDVVPTMLNWMGLPAGRDMRGCVISKAFQRTVDLAPIRTWNEKFSAPTSSGVPGIDRFKSHFEVMRQFVALGYMPAAILDQEKAVITVKNEQNFNLAVVLLHHGQVVRALEILEILCHNHPSVGRYQFARLEALRRLNRHAEALRVIDSLQDDNNVFALSRAASLYGVSQAAEAMAVIQQALAIQPNNLGILTTSGQMALLQGDWTAAEKWFLKALDIQPDHAGAHGGLAQAKLELGDPSAAIAHAGRSLERFFFNPDLHWSKARAYHALGDYENAVIACGWVLRQEPRHEAARTAMLEWAKSLPA